METPDAGQNIITRGLPKTGQTTQYTLGDDGSFQAGWWRGRLNANNRERWIAKAIGGDDIVIDRATGLMWAGDGNAAGCNNGAIITWSNAIAYATGLNFATFTDWRLPNVFELASITRFKAPRPLIEQPPFSNTVSVFEGYWSSTTDPYLNTAAHYISFYNGKFYTGPKIDEYYIRCVRKGL